MGGDRKENLIIFPPVSQNGHFISCIFMCLIWFHFKYPNRKISPTFLEACSSKIVAQSNKWNFHIKSHRPLKSILRQTNTVFFCLLSSPIFLFCSYCLPTFYFFFSPWNQTLKPNFFSFPSIPCSNKLLHLLSVPINSPLLLFFILSNFFSFSLLFFLILFYSYFHHFDSPVKTFFLFFPYFYLFLILV